MQFGQRGPPGPQRFGGFGGPGMQFRGAAQAALKDLVVPTAVPVLAARVASSAGAAQAV